MTHALLPAEPNQDYAMTTPPASLRAHPLITQHPALDGVPLLDLESNLATITPAVAQALLEGNVANRRVHERHLDRLTNALRRGEWRPNGAPIVVDSVGKLVDGQHRLAAVVRSDVPIQALLVVLPAEKASEAQLTMDTGSRRTFSDHLTILGVPNATVLATMCSALWFYEHPQNEGAPARWKVQQFATFQQLEAILVGHPDMPESIHIGFGVVGMRKTEQAVLHYLLSQASDVDTATDFMRALSRGENLAAGDPAYTWRERMRDPAKTKGLVPAVRYALHIKTWNAWVQGTPLHTLRLSLGGTSREQYPTILPGA